jgi:hypothetical protein
LIGQHLSERTRAAAYCESLGVRLTEFAATLPLMFPDCAFANLPSEFSHIRVELEARWGRWLHRGSLERAGNTLGQANPVRRIVLFRLPPSPQQLAAAREKRAALTAQLIALLPRELARLLHVVFHTVLEEEVSLFVIRIQRLQGLKGVLS